jgi:putative aldouronate transport system substrate-binding protein
MKMKKLVVLLTVTIMLAGLVAGCQTTGATPTIAPTQAPTVAAATTAAAAETPAVAAEPVTLKMVTCRDAGEGSFTEKYISTDIQKRTGIKLDVTEIDSAAWSEKKGILFATNELPDIFLGVTFSPEEEVSYGTGGQLIALNSIIDKVGVETKKMFEQYPYVVPAITTPDGNIYAMPRNDNNTRSMAVGGRFFLNTTWLKELNVAIPTTLDQFYDALVAIKGKGDNIIPVGGIYGQYDISQFILNALGYVEGKFALDKTNTNVVYVPVQPEYKEYLTFMNKLWKNGLLDKEYFTQSADTFVAKGQQMRYGFYTYAAHYLMVGDKNYDQYEIIPPLTSDMNKTQMTGEYSGVMRGNAAITKVCKDPETAYKLIDYCYSYEGTLMVLGITDQPVYNGSATFKVRKEDGKNQYVWPSEFDSFWTFGIQKIGHYLMPFNINDWWRNYYEEPNEASLSKNFANGLAKYYRFVYPQVYLTKEQTETINKYDADLSTYVKQMDAKFITGEVSLDTFDDYVKTANSMGVADMIKVYQDAYDVYQKNNK